MPEWRPRILWVSQIADAEQRVGRCLPDERETAPGALPDARVSVVDATEETLPDPALFDGIVVAGSVGCVHDAAVWRPRLAAWVSGLGEMPFLGICGGHQLYARVHGGEVTRGGHDQVGLFPLDVPGLPGGVGEVIHLHSDAVTRIPEAAEVWAADGVCVQALRYGSARWTFQFHPELDGAAAQRMWAGAVANVDPGRLAVAVSGGAGLMRAWTNAVALRCAGGRAQ